MIDWTLFLTAASCLYLPKDISRGISESGWVDTAFVRLGRFRNRHIHAQRGQEFHVSTAFRNAVKNGWVEVITGNAG
jgi:hypothetical protein